jgi:hypothetical protein
LRDVEAPTFSDIRHTDGGTRTGDLPACGIQVVPQPLTLPRAPFGMILRHLNDRTFSDYSLYLNEYLNKIYSIKFGGRYYAAKRSVYIYNQFSFHNSNSVRI